MCSWKSKEQKVVATRMHVWMPMEVAPKARKTGRSASFINNILLIMLTNPSISVIAVGQLVNN